MTIEKTLQENTKMNNLEDISEEEIYSNVWSRVIVKDITICNTFVYCKKDDLKSEGYNIEWTYELSSDFGGPKKNLKNYFSDEVSLDHKYSDHNRRKIAHNINDLNGFVLDDTEWLYYKDKKVKVTIESLDSSYEKSFFVEYTKSFDGVPTFEDQTHKNNYKYICNLLEKRRERSILVRKKNDTLVTMINSNDPPDIFVDKLSDITKKSFLLFFLISSIFVGSIIFLLPIFIFHLFFGQLFSLILIPIYFLLGCKYLCLLTAFYPFEITSKIGNYIYRDKYEFVPIND